MKGKIAIVGAGHGGLVAAHILGRHGYKVDIFEKNKQGEVSYDWHDDVTPHVFTRLNIPLPDSKHYFWKRDWSFVTPDGKSIIRIYQDRKKLTYPWSAAPWWSCSWPGPRSGPASITKPGPKGWLSRISGSGA